MKLKKNYWCLLLVIALVISAFFLDIFSSRLMVEIGPQTIIDKDGKVITNLQVIYPLWHQFVNLGKHFLYGLSATIFITVFVVNKLEDIQKNDKEEELKKLHDAINVNVFDSLFKTIIPEEIFKVIKQDIIENKVVRKDAKWIYDFKQENEKIICTQTTRYELHNLSQAEVVDPIKLELDSIGGEPYKILSAECLEKNGNNLVYYNTNDPDNTLNITVKEEEITTVEYTLRILICPHFHGQLCSHF